jgi:hypothetical protein
MPLKRLFKVHKRRLFNRVHDLRFGHYKRQIQANILPESNANEFISNSLKSNRPFFAGRLGYIECLICWNYARASFSDLNHSRKLTRSASNNAGISTLGDPSLDRFASIYIASLPYADLIGMWEITGIYALLHKFSSPDLQYTGLESLEPWPAYFAKREPWTKSLNGKSVLVVHPFARSVERQFARRAQVKSIREILPDFDLLTVAPPVTFAQQDNGKTWATNLQLLMGEVAKCKFDVAIIGCGAYGLPLGAFVKQMGRQAIHLGGATQLLFGIRGKRWDDRGLYPRLMDETWVRPSQDERPKAADSVEEGCYW